MSNQTIIPCIAVVHGNRLLLLQRAADSKFPNKWCIPGGKIEAGETPMICAIRELREETGISIGCPDSNIFRHLGDYPSEALDDNQQPFMLCVYVLVVNRRLPVTIEHDKFQGFGWFTFPDVVNLLAMTPAKQVAWDLGIERRATC